MVASKKNTHKKGPSWQGMKRIKRGLKWKVV
jgi:hypothetical protein